MTQFLKEVNKHTAVFVHTTSAADKIFVGDWVNNVVAHTSRTTINCGTTH